MRLVGLALVIVPLLLAAQQPGEIQPQANPQPARPEDKCSIEGQVTNAQTGEPLKKAHVRLLSNNGQQNNVYGAVTDAGGHFAIQDIDPGSYTLFAERNGFAQEQYAAPGTSRGFTPLSLNSGQRVRDANFRLIPFGVIAGRILDEDGEPVEHAQVTVTRFMRGRRQPGQAGAGQTDDLGEYRIFGLEAGKYYLSAIYRQQNMMAQDRTPAGTPDEGYAPTFYPGTNDPAGAVVIDVVPGAQLRGVDVTLLKTRTWRIRGKVTNGLGERLPRPVFLMLLPREKAAMGFYPRSTTQIRNGDGTFELRGVTSGSYTLMAQCWDEGKDYFARQSVDVGNNNVDNISLLLSAGLELKGTVRVDGPDGTALGNLQVSLAPQEMMSRMGMQGGRVGDNGSFSLSNVPPAVYTINVSGMAETFYIKSVRMGDADALEAGLDLTRGGAGMLEILLSPNGGQVDGSLADPKQGMSNAVVVLAPEGRRREQRAFFKMANCDAQGHFTIKGIAPGDYKLFAWDQSEPVDYQDPEVLKPFENQGEAITIRESSHESVQIKLMDPDAKAGKAAN